MLGLLGAIGGIAGMLIQRAWQRRDARRAEERADRDKLQAHVLDSLKWFEGKSQRRSIGISVIEGNWNKFSDLRPTWIAVLTNQAVYLLAQSGQDDALHERANLARIMQLLDDGHPCLTPSQIAGVCVALAENEKGKGLRGLEKEVKEWSRKWKCVAA